MPDRFCRNPVSFDRYRPILGRCQTAHPRWRHGPTDNVTRVCRPETYVPNWVSRPGGSHGQICSTSQHKSFGAAMTDFDFLQIDSDTLIPDEPSLAAMIVNLATDQDIRARVHELLMLAERPAPQEERRRD